MNARHCTVVLLFVEFLHISFFVSSASAQKTLRLRLEPGQSFHIHMVQDTTVELDLPGQPGELRHKFTWDSRQSVKEVTADGTATVEQQFQRVQISLSGNPQQAGQYDSDRPDDRPEGVLALVAPAFDALTKHSVTLKVSPTAKIVDIELPSELTQAIGNASDLPGLAEMFSKEGITQLLRHSMLAFPENPVRKGDSWEDTYEMPHPLTGKLRITSRYTYDGEAMVEGHKVDVIRVKISYMTAAENAGVQRVKLHEHDVQGTLYIDAATGMLRSGTINDKTVMRINDMFNQTSKGTTRITVRASSE